MSNLVLPSANFNFEINVITLLKNKFTMNSSFHVFMSVYNDMD